MSLAIKEISLPGIQFDEVFDATPTIDLMKKKEVSEIICVRLLGRNFPLMAFPYHGSLKSYIQLPFFLIFGINVFALRLASISFGLFTLIFAYLFAKELFDRKVAFITILLLATSPYYILATKIQNYTAFFSTGALLSFLRWYKGRNNFYYFSGMLLLGLGLSTIGYLFLFAIALSLLAFVFRRNLKSRISARRFNSISLYFIGGMLFLCLGNFLVVYANFIHEPSRFITFEYLFGHFSNTKGNINNFSYISNIFSRLRNLLEILGERKLINNAMPYNYKIGNTLYSYIFFFLFSWLLGSLSFRKNLYFNKKRIGFLMALVGTMFFVSPFTLSFFLSEHLFILVPFIQIIISTGMIEFIYAFRGKMSNRISQGFAAISLLLLVGYNGLILKDYFVDVKRTGGQFIWSDAIYRLADWLKEIKPAEIITVNWGLSRNLYLLFEGEKYIHDLHWHSDIGFSEEELIKRYMGFFQDVHNRYLVNVQWPDKIDQGLFEKAVEKAGKRLISEKLFYQRDGMHLYTVYAVR